MSPPNSEESSGTLYNPPSNPENSASSNEETVGLRVTLSEDQRKRLRAVAEQLGLPPSTLAQRAIEMVCDEVVTIQEDNRPPTLLVEQYQARIDLLHGIENASSAGPTSSGDTPPDDESDQSEDEESIDDEENTDS